MDVQNKGSKLVEIERHMTPRERMLAGRVNLLEVQLDRLRQAQKQGYQSLDSNSLEETDRNILSKDESSDAADVFELFSSEDLKRLQSTKMSQDHLREKFQNIRSATRYRSLGGATSEQVLAVERLGEKYANFKPFVEEYVLPQLKVQKITGEHVQLQNFCLVGPPGIGKTAFLNSLAEALGLGGRIFDASSIQTSAVLNGLTRNFGNADVGLLFQTLIFGRTRQNKLFPANALFCIDEVEKVGQTEQLGATQDLLLALLEPQTARRFVDASAPEMPINLEHINWAFTSNTLDELNGPLRSRLIHIEIPKPTPEQSLAIARTIFDHEVSKLSGKVDVLPTVDPNDLEALCEYSPREQKQLLNLAIARAISLGDGKLKIESTNMRAKFRMGFL